LNRHIRHNTWLIPLALSKYKLEDPKLSELWVGRKDDKHGDLMASYTTASSDSQHAGMPKREKHRHSFVHLHQ
jgi:hypothetical protein